MGDYNRIVVIVYNERITMNEFNHIIITESDRDLKGLARMALNGLWKKAFIGILIYSFFVEIIPIIIDPLIPFAKYTYTYPDLDYSLSFSPVSYFYQFIIGGPFMIGLCKYILLIVRRREVNYNYIFKGFDHFIKAFLLNLLIMLFIGLWTFPIVIVSSFLMVVLPAAGFITLIVVPIVALWAFLNYSMATFFLADDPSLSPMSCIKLSKAHMKGNKGNLFMLMLSFLGWAILAFFIQWVLTAFIPASNTLLLILGGIIGAIPTMFVSLYMNVAKGFFYEILTGHLRKEPF